MLTSPFTPMLFMGEEWGARTPWQFFTSHPEPELGKATAEGRIGEFAEHGWDADVVPDPQDPETFTRSKLDWSELAQEPHERLLAVHRALLALRRAHPDLRRPRPVGGRRSAGTTATAGWSCTAARCGWWSTSPTSRGRSTWTSGAADVLFTTGELPVLDGATVTLPAESAAVLTTR